jgi:hypothetical protein
VAGLFLQLKSFRETLVQVKPLIRILCVPIGPFRLLLITKAPEHQKHLVGGKHSGGKSSIFHLACRLQAFSIFHLMGRKIQQRKILNVTFESHNWS